MFLSFVSLYTIYIGIASNMVKSSAHTNLLSEKAELKTLRSANSTYKFDNPILAYKILTLLQINEITHSNKSALHTSRLDTRPDPDYCAKALERFTDHPEIVFQQKNFFNDYNSKSLTRRMLRTIGTIVPPKVHYFKSLKKQKRFKLPLDIVMMFATEYFHEDFPMGKYFGCSHQMYNRLLRINSLANKAIVAQKYENYIIKYSDRPQCIKRSIPESYLLYNTTQCKTFFKYIQSSEYKQEKKKNGIVFLQKTLGVHMGEGVFLLDKENEKAIKKDFKNGKECSTRSDTKIQMQRYLDQPFLLYGHKFDFRIYMLIASVKPFIVYYHDGILRVSLQIYNSESREKSTHFTNTHLAEDFFKIAKDEGNWKGMTEEELRDFQTWNFTRIHNYALETGATNDSNWLDNYLRPEIQRVLVHLIRATESSFLQRSNIYQLWGMDFMMDADLNLWFIEANTRPGIKSTSGMRTKFLEHMLLDMFDIMFAHLRSRMKRVILYVNDMIKNMSLESFLNEGIKIADIEEKRKIFASNVNINFMDPEFKPKKTNFTKIVDENLQGTDRYNNLISKDCL